MNVTIETVASAWLSQLLHASLYGGVAILVVFAVAWIARRLIQLPAWVEHWMWRFVYAKLLILLLVSQSIPLPILQPNSEPSELPRLAMNNASLGKFELPANEGNQEINAANIVAANGAANKVPQASATWTVLLCFGWLTGVLCNVAILFRQSAATRQLKLRHVTTPWLVTECAQLCESFSITHRPRITASSDVSGPALIGFFQPTIVISESVLSNAERQPLRAVLAHELAHLKRHDLWWNLLAAMAQVFFFFHPLLWFAHARWRLSRELATDALAIECSADSPAHYGDALLKIAVLVAGRTGPSRSLSEVGALYSAHSLKIRIYEMRNFATCDKRLAIVFSTCLVGVAMLGLPPWQPVSQQAVAAPLNNQPVVGDQEEGPVAIGDNMDFEQKTELGLALNWGGGGQGYALTLDDEKPRSGNTCGWISGGSEVGFGTFTQCLEPATLAGKRVNFQGFLRSDLRGSGGLWMRVDAGEKAVSFDNMLDRPIQGKTEWTKYDVVLDVPADATKICFGFLMTGKGNLWADDFSIQAIGPVGQGVPTTGVKQDELGPAQSFNNLSFEEPSNGNAYQAKGWGGGGAGYKLARDVKVKHAGDASGCIQQTSPSGMFGTFTQMIPAKDYLGKRVRFNGFLKTKEANSSGLWMRVDGTGTAPLAFDNMQSRAVTGSTEWTKFAVVLDVPKDATNLALGFLLIGSGTVWGDDLNIEIVGDIGTGPPTTGSGLGK